MRHAVMLWFQHATNEVMNKCKTQQYFQRLWHSWHHNFGPGKAQRVYMGTFSMLFRMVKELHLAMFSFLLFFPTLGKRWPDVTGIQFDENDKQFEKVYTNS